jgi:hypothetical protein
MRAAWRIAQTNDLNPFVGVKHHIVAAIAADLAAFGAEKLRRRLRATTDQGKDKKGDDPSLHDALSLPNQG